MKFEFVEVMAEIPGGTFLMGSPDDEQMRLTGEGPQHKVTVAPFFMSKYPITQAQYEAVMGKNPSYFEGTNFPVENVSWYNAVEFCRKLSHQSSYVYRLPTEAEWEYACRARTKTPFHFGETITTDRANYDGEPDGQYRGGTTSVGSFLPNAFGLYDMHGNVWEWCQDVWHDSYEEAPTDGSAWIEGDDQNHHIVRGGSWLNSPRNCRSACRSYYAPDYRDLNVGFRVVTGVR